MIQLQKISNKFFNEYYTGENGNRKVVCTLDKYSVRYFLYEGEELKKRYDFLNEQKEICYRLATNALNN